jgi:transcriptional regulator with XRE-family HTH domain
LVLSGGSRTDRDMLTPRQLWAARALIGWSREDLAAASKVPVVTIGEFETFKTDPRLTTVHKLRRALEKAGVRFIDADDDGGPGVRLKEAEDLPDKPARRRSRAAPKG